MTVLITMVIISFSMNSTTKSLKENKEKEQIKMEKQIEFEMLNYN